MSVHLCGHHKRHISVYDGRKGSFTITFCVLVTMNIYGFFVPQLSRCVEHLSFFKCFYLISENVKKAKVFYSDYGEEERAR